VKEITAVARLSDEDLTKIVYLRVKAFIPVDQNIPCHIKDFTKGQVIFLKESLLLVPVGIVYVLFCVCPFVVNKKIYLIFFLS
jgi:hypothetical protein